MAAAWDSLRRCGLRFKAWRRGQNTWQMGGIGGYAPCLLRVLSKRNFPFHFSHRKNKHGGSL